MPGAHRFRAPASATARRRPDGQQPAPASPPDAWRPCRPNGSGERFDPAPRSAASRSASTSSVSMVSISDSGSTLPGNVSDVVIDKTANDVRDRIGFANMGKGKLVTQSRFTLRSTGNQPRDIDKLHHPVGGHHLFRRYDFGQRRQAGIRHRHHAEIGPGWYRTGSSRPQSRPWSGN